VSEEEPLRFSLRRKTRKVTLLDEHDVEKDYILRELDGAERDRWLTIMGKKMKMGTSGPTGVQDFTGIQAELLGLSIVDEEGKKVNVPTIQSWPSSVQTALFKIVQEMSGLGDTNKVEEQVKND
jgi:hypothetical protein